MGEIEKSGILIFLFHSDAISYQVDFLSSVQKLSRLQENNSKQCFNNFILLEYHLCKKSH